MSDLTANFHNALRRLISEKYKSQSVLAEAMNVSEGTISKWLRQPVRTNAKRIIQVAGIINIEVNSFDLPSTEFDLFLSRLMPAVVRENPLRELKAVSKSAASWASEFESIRGTWKYLYTHRSGAIEVSEIQFRHIQKMGIDTFMRNWNTTSQTEKLQWDYAGHTYAINNYAYVVLSEMAKGPELFFMIFRLPTGSKNEQLFGHILVLGTQGSVQRSSVSPCVLIPADSIKDLSAAYGTYELADVIEKGFVTSDSLRHLADCPSAELLKQIEARVSNISRPSAD